MKNLFSKFFPFLFFILLCSFFVIQSCTEFDSTVTSDENFVVKKSPNELKNAISTIAHALSIFLNDEKNRELLKMEIDKSKYRESILEAKTFFSLYQNSIISNGNRATSLAEVISDYLPSSEKTSFLSTVKNLNFGEIDIYFPIKIQRDEWTPEKPLQIVRIDELSDLKNDTEVTGFDLKGNAISLNSSIMPEIATLSVGFSEKRGNYPLKENTEIDYLVHGIKINSLGDSPANENGQTTHFFRLKVLQLIVEDDGCCNGLFEGDLEYYTAVWHPTGGSYLRTNFYESYLSDEGVYYMNRSIFAYGTNGITPYPGGSTQTTKIMFKEDDGGLLGEDDTAEEWWHEDFESNPASDAFHFSNIATWYYGHNNYINLEIKWEQVY